MSIFTFYFQSNRHKNANDFISYVQLAYPTQEDEKIDQWFQLFKENNFNEDFYTLSKEILEKQFQERSIYYLPQDPHFFGKLAADKIFDQSFTNSPNTIQKFLETQNLQRFYKLRKSVMKILKVIALIFMFKTIGANLKKIILGLPKRKISIGVGLTIIYGVGLLILKGLDTSHKLKRFPIIKSIFIPPGLFEVSTILDTLLNWIKILSLTFGYLYQSHLLDKNLNQDHTYRQAKCLWNLTADKCLNKT